MSEKIVIKVGKSKIYTSLVSVRVGLGEGGADGVVGSDGVAAGVAAATAAGGVLPALPAGAAAGLAPAFAAPFAAPAAGVAGAGAGSATCAAAVVVGAASGSPGMGISSVMRTRVNNDVSSRKVESRALR